MIRRLIISALLMLSCMAASSQGLKLFSPEIRSASSYQHQVVMDFIERYFTELKNQRQTSAEIKMADDKVYFREGKPSDLYLVNDTMPFSISMQENRYYEVKWMRQNSTFITLVFPAQYDLLLGLNQQKAQEQFRNAVLAAPENEGSAIIPCDLQKQDDGIYVAKTDKFELESLNNAVYFNKVQNSFQPVFDKEYLDYSAANLFHGLIANANYRMYVEQSVYGLKTIEYTIPFNKWLDYCAQQKLKVFFTVEEQREDGILALVVAKSVELGFTHMLSVVIPDKFVSNKNTVLKARITPYIPQHNVKNLYKQQTTKSKKKVWQ